MSFLQAKVFTFYLITLSWLLFIHVSWIILSLYTHGYCVDLLLAHRFWRLPNINLAMGQRLVCDGLRLFWRVAAGIEISVPSKHYTVN